MLTRTKPFSTSRTGIFPDVKTGIFPYLDQRCFALRFRTIARNASLGRTTAFVPSFPTFRSSAASFSLQSRPNESCPPTSTARSYSQQPLESTSSNRSSTAEPFQVNLLTIPLPELQTLLQSWDQPPFRARQIRNWIFSQGVLSIDQMTDLPLQLRTLLKQRTTVGSLQLQIEQVSVDGTKKRAYKLHDGQIIESVLMPYEDGRRTACISSQAGCAMGCVFCATGQMGFARQLTDDEIFEQVARFAAELRGNGERLSNVVMMGMGEVSVLRLFGTSLAFRFPRSRSNFVAMDGRISRWPTIATSSPPFAA